MFYEQNLKKMNTPTIKIYQRKDYQKNDNSNSIFLRLTIARKPKSYNLHISVPDSQWDEKTSNVKKNNPDYIKYNKMIQNAVKRAGDIVLMYNLENKQLTFNDFEKQFLLNFSENGKFNNYKISVYDFWENEIKIKKGNLSNETIRSYECQLSKLKEFRKKLTFDEITHNFLKEYEKHLKEERGNNKNTIKNSMKTIRAIVKSAINNKITNNYPFESYKIGVIKGDRVALNINELKSLEKLYYENTLNSQLKNTLRCFLFCCYTALRYGDLKTLKYIHLKDDHIVKEMNKTKICIEIPLNDKAKKIIPNLDQEHFINQKVFKVFCNQKFNEYLKEIMKIVEIDKSISFHCARHTFATIALTIGIPLPVIQNILGHTDIKTTQIYIKVENELKMNEMAKFNNI